jgi:transposase
MTYRRVDTNIDAYQGSGILFVIEIRTKADPLRDSQVIRKKVFKVATGWFAVGRAIAVRTDITSGELRRLAKRARNAAQARRLLAIAALLDGALRKDAARAGGMNHQTLRDWVIRFNAKGPEGLIDIPSPGAPSKLDDTHKAFLARIVGQDPIAAADGVVRWRARDLVMRLQEEFGLSVSDDTVYRTLKELGLSHVSRQPTGRTPKSLKHLKRLATARTESALDLCGD